jgi:hypothetical protein
MNNVRELVGALETLDSARYPRRSGPELLLHLVAKGLIGGKDGLGAFFCPGDGDESLEQAGGVAAYAALDLERKDHGHLTSYAAADGSKMRKGMVPAPVLVADDSDDHHDGRGIVIGLAGGSVKWRDKFDDYALDKATELIVGEGSAIEELACLRRS